MKKNTFGMPDAQALLEAIEIDLFGVEEELKVFPSLLQNEHLKGVIPRRARNCLEIVQSCKTAREAARKTLLFINGQDSTFNEDMRDFMAIEERLKPWLEPAT